MEKTHGSFAKILLGLLVLIVICAAACAVARSYFGGPLMMAQKGNPAAIRIESLTPASGPVGSRVTVIGSGFSADDIVLMGGLAAAKQFELASAKEGLQSITFTVPSSLSPDCQSNGVCPLFLRETTSGSYSLAIKNTASTSNEGSFTVTGSSTFPQ